MNGNRYLLDTNTIIYAIKNGSLLPKGHYLVSIISEMELLSYSKITVAEENCIRELLANFEIIRISDEIKEKAITVRKKSNLKLPDAIICATSLSSGSTLVTNDQKLLNTQDVSTIKISELLQ